MRWARSAGFVSDGSLLAKGVVASIAPARTPVRERPHPDQSREFTDLLIAPLPVGEGMGVRAQQTPMRARSGWYNEPLCLVSA